MIMNVGFVLDVAVLVLLGVTVFYAARLSYFMSHFRQGKNDMARLLADLSRQVTQAENAMSGMRGVAEKAGGQLQEIINEAKFLSDELRFMNESGDNLAGRLEKLAERNRELVNLLEGAGGIGSGEPAVTPGQAASRTRPMSVLPPSFLMSEDHNRRDKPELPKPVPATPVSGFAIHDRDFDDDGLEQDEAPAENEYAFVPAGKFASQAEKDLYDALLHGRGKAQKVR
jgi:hypothetical protein